MAITWTDQEKQQVLARMIQLMRADTELSKSRAFAAAIEVLPPDRRRVFNSGMATERWIILPEDIPASRTGYGARGVKIGKKLVRSTEFGRAAEREDKSMPIQPEQLAAALPPLPPIDPNYKPATGATLLRWTSVEMATLARYAALAMHYGVAKNVGHAFTAAQERLPAERRHGEVKSRPWMKPALNKELAIIKRTEAKLLKKRIDEEQSRQKEELQATEMQSVEMTLHDAQEDAAALQRAADTPAVETPAPAAVAANRIPPSELIKDLVERRVSQREIAAAMGIEQPTISLLLHGKNSDTNSASYFGLLELHRKYCGSAPTPLATVTTPPTMGEAIDTLTTGLRQLVSDYVAGIFTEAIDKVLADLPGRLQRALTASVPQPTAQVQQVNGHAHTQSSEVVPKHVPFVRGDGSDKLKLTKVLVVGGKRSVHSIIEGKLGHKLKLEFVEQDESAGAVKMRMGAADVVVAWTDYCSHSHVGAVKSRAERYAMVEGGVTAVLDKLELIATTPVEDLAERLNIQRKPQVTANGAVAH